MLNEKQSQVANELKRNILLSAPAGTGKTNTLSQRIKNILEEGVAEAKQILCITFTNKACKEMKDRIESLVGSSGKEVEVKTFHGMCFDIIRQEAKRNTDLYTGFIVYDDEDSLSLMHEFLEENISAKDIKIMVDYIRREAINYNIFSEDKLEDYKRVVNAINNDNHKLNSFMSIFRHNSDSMLRVFQDFGPQYTARYIEVLRRNGAVDFQDLMNLTYELFLDSEVVKRYASKYKFINIDETQDTSLVEYSIVEKLFGDSNILLCGDNFQTIYEWRGSNPIAIYKNFKAKYNPVEIVFDCNYRATKILTECSTSFLKNAFPEEVDEFFENGLSAYSTEKGDKIDFYVANNVADEARWIYEKIIELPEEERGSACILTRNNVYNISLSSQLRDYTTKKGALDFALIDDSKFFRKSEIKDVLAFLKLAANHTDGTALRRILNRLSYRIGEVTLANIESKEYKESGILLNDLIDKNALENKDKFATLVNELKNNNVIVFDVESTGVDTSRDEIIQIAAIKIDEEGNEIDRFMRFLKTDKSVGESEAVHGFSDKFLENNGEDKETVLLEFLEFVDGRVIVGHNVQYDINILKSELGRKNLPKPNFLTFYDTLDIYRRFYPNYENHKLETISALVNTKHKPNHNALYDILATGEILVHAVKEKIIPTMGKRVELMRNIPQRFDVLAADMSRLFELVKGKRPHEIIQMVVKGFKLIEVFGGESSQAANLRELYFVAKLYDDANLSTDDALIDFVKTTALSDGEMEKILLSKGRIPIITIHQAKGLEFKHVFLAGLQNYVFPNFQALASKNLKEEKRIMYVAITRAKKKLYMSYSKNKNGRFQQKSELLRYIDDQYLVYNYK